LTARSFDEWDTRGYSVRLREALGLLAEPAFAEPRVDEVLGPRHYTLDEATRILGAAVGRTDVRYAQIPYDEARRAMIDAGMSPSFADAVMETARSFNDGLAWEQEARSRRNTTRTTLEQFAAEVFAPAYEAAARAVAPAPPEQAARPGDPAR
jgi:hypothetical protein